uniref:PPFIA binding protein 2 n=1 Tax=Myripristis murdjan TaxID=586833 RepID=A0A668A791_9TELE
MKQVNEISSKAAAVEFSNSLYDLGSPISAGPLQVIQLAEDLKLALELQPSREERDSLRAQLPAETAQALIDWLQSGTVNLCSPVNNESYQERLVRLEGDKESLVLQVSVLTDQVEAQGEKIRDLESSLEEHHQKLVSTEEMLQQELLSRTSLETQKLDLMDEVSYLKLKLVGMEETHTSTPPQDAADSKQNKAEDLLQEVKQLKSKVEELEAEKSQYERKLRATKAEISELQQLLASKDAEIECLQNQLLARGGTANDNAERDQEFQRLKAGMESLLASNDEKDRHIEELTILLSQYRKMKEVMALTQGNALLAVFHFFLFCNILSVLRLYIIFPYILANKRCMHFNSEVYFVCRNRHRLLSSSLEELQSGSLQKVTAALVQVLKKALLSWDGFVMDSVLATPAPAAAYSTNNNSHNHLSETHTHTHTLSHRLVTSVTLSASIFGSLIRRSQSGSPVQVDDPELGEFRRGGFRATAGPRLARTGNTRDPKTPFSKWTTEQVCDWLEELGLGQYGILARHWVTSGQTLLSATPQDLEKELGVRNPLHRKKLQLAIKTCNTKQPEKSAELDHVWVTRWLDDIGLPQYKDQFNEGRVDGQMLQYLTVNDLLFLRVTSQLHHLSIKCAIHVLHVNKFNPNCLKRRPSNEVSCVCTTPNDVVQWSNHRVMEWLRSVDLAEYAPNLRGSGVHGGLIILEPRFNSDTLAMLLNIPPQKTLLRRHLATNFSSLVGVQAQQEKREYTEAASYTPLSTTAKVRPKKLGFSNLTHLRRKRPDDSTDYICPMEASQLQSPSGQSVMNGVQVRPYAGFRGLSPILDREPDRSRDQVGLDDS